jgi:Cu-processing system permease protein
MAHLKEDLWGIYVISKREFVANIKSFRSLIMVFIMALIMVGAAMGFASLSTTEESEVGMMYQRTAMDDDGLANDLVVFLYEVGTMEPVPGSNVTLRVEELENRSYTGATDENGQWVAKNLTPAFHWLFVPEGDGGTDPNNPFAQLKGSETYIYVPHNRTATYPALGVEARNLDIRDVGTMEDVVVWVVGPDGSPSVGATVNLGNLSGTTNAQGITEFHKVKKGVFIVTATDGTLDGMAIVNVTRMDVERDPFAFALEGPDQVLRLVAAIAIGMVGPIYAIVLCFDSVFRERLSGSIDYLLCRPMGRRAVLMGKFVGILAALMVPITAVSLMGVGVVTWQSGESPTMELVVGFLVYTVFLIAIFTLLQMIFSTVAKTTGTAILSGIGMWIFFFMLFDLILLLVSYANGMEGDTQTIFFNRASFFNPISVYSLSMGMLGSEETLMGVPDWAPPVALVAYMVVLLMAAMEIFKRRVTE